LAEVYGNLVIVVILVMEDFPVSKETIGGWSRALVGEQYGYGYSVRDLQKWLSKS